ncbi:MAG: hypothetical protein QF437_20310 [Planctomycetota bacterium]|jgi:hypothetical protein|nr:hypothetical protein [Planctomycetota bacterium]MDP7132850.1 hypothetical protein [Planctomycetota bacterium]MDP7249393.1 hypothetical protein [Planctomycetota bacterium]
MKTNLFILISAFLSIQIARAETAPSTAPDELTEGERAFQELLTGAILQGSFTEVRNDKVVVSGEEKYTIESVSKTIGNLWLFKARVQYGNKDVTVPMLLKVEWAGETPVVTLTELSIPGLGTYSSRVIFYNQKYAGTWSANDHGGHLFGKIIKKSDGNIRPEK